MINLTSKKDCVWDSVERSVWHTVRYSVGDSVRRTTLNDQSKF